MISLLQTAKQKQHGVQIELKETELLIGKDEARTRWLQACALCCVCACCVGLMILANVFSNR